MTRFLAFAIGLFLGGIIALQFVDAKAQDDACEPTGTPESVTSGQRLLGQADFDEVAGGPSRLTSTQITLAPGASTQPFVNAGPVLIVVQEGTVTLTADLAQVGLPPEPALGGIEVEIESASPEAANAVAVTKGEQIALPQNAAAQISNNSDEGVRLLLISLNPTDS